MQCSYDSKGNSVPTILLLMQERLYSQGGLKVAVIDIFCVHLLKYFQIQSQRLSVCMYVKHWIDLQAEGIFRINPENSQEEEVRDQLNKGTVPDDIDVHCLAGLIKVCSSCSLNCLQSENQIIVLLFRSNRLGSENSRKECLTGSLRNKFFNATQKKNVLILLGSCFLHRLLFLTGLSISWPMSLRKKN